jgi:hypothetical protein
LINIKRSIIFLGMMNRKPCNYGAGCFKFQKGQDCGFGHDNGAAMTGSMGGMGGMSAGMGKTSPNNPNPMMSLGSKPCIHGQNCNNWKKGVCRYGHDSMPMQTQPMNNTNVCKYGTNCNKWKQGNCPFNHSDLKTNMGNIPVEVAPTGPPQGDL